MTDETTSISEESPPVRPQGETLPPAGGRTPAQLVSIELSVWLNIKETD
ncbi:MAG: hypothetical protein GKS00_13590 [Alphaproteobacteria bacterium]|nr:hypothetical protein [Alphaproteobacteria bacterium]